MKKNLANGISRDLLSVFQRNLLVSRFLQDGIRVVRLVKKNDGMIVYESDDHKVFAEYDLPSTLFGQFGIKEIAEVGISLDGKLLDAITRADKAGA